MIYQLFGGGFVSAFSEGVDSPDQAHISQTIPGYARLNVIAKKVEEFTLNDGATRAISFANYPAAAPTEWVQWICRVVGDAQIDVTGKDTDNLTTITSKIRAYGVEIFPGIIMLSNYNGTGYIFEGLADGTKIELFAALCVEDDDARWTSLA